MTENNNNNLENDAAQLRETLIEDAENVNNSTSRVFEVTPDELLQTTKFLQARIADLVFELGVSEVKNANLINYIGMLEQKLNIAGTDLSKVKHPDL